MPTTNTSPPACLSSVLPWLRTRLGSASRLWHGVGLQAAGVAVLVGATLPGPAAPAEQGAAVTVRPVAATTHVPTGTITGPSTATTMSSSAPAGAVAGLPDGVSNGVSTSGWDCAWWDMACQGAGAAADAGMAAVTESIAAGAGQLLGEIVRIVDASTRVPLADPTYRRIYTGFLKLAAPLVGVVLFAALIVAGLRRDPGVLGRAVTGLVVAGLGGVLYLVFAQLLVAVDDWLSHSIVAVTGRDLADALTGLAAGFHQIADTRGDVAANMLLIILMLIMLLAGLVLWFVLVLRQVAILVVVAFAPLLIAGWLWAPTRPWVRRATEVLVGLVFAKSAIYALFGIGMALIARGREQTLADFVGAVVLLCGACFAPLVTLRLVHFAADTQVAGDMMATLRGGMTPVLSHLPHHIPGHRGPGTGSGPSEGAGGGSGTAGSGRRDNARYDAQAPTRTLTFAGTGTGTGGGLAPGPGAGGSAASGAGSGAGAPWLTAAAAGAETARRAAQHAQDTASQLSTATDPGGAPAPDGAGRDGAGWAAQPGTGRPRLPDAPADPPADPPGNGGPGGGPEGAR